LDDIEYLSNLRRKENIIQEEKAVVRTYEDAITKINNEVESLRLSIENIMPIIKNCDGKNSDKLNCNNSKFKLAIQQCESLMISNYNAQTILIVGAIDCETIKSKKNCIIIMDYLERCTI